MDELLTKLSSYNILNYLLPGTLFVVFIDNLTSYSLIQNDILVGAFLYYFIGLVISRFGSLIIEPLLKKISFLQFAPYPEFIAASKEDPKIEIFSEENNMYRTFSAMFILILLLKIFVFIESQYSVLTGYNTDILTVLLLAVFLFSYRKQTKYISNRIKANNKKI